MSEHTYAHFPFRPTFSLVCSSFFRAGKFFVSGVSAMHSHELDLLWTRISGGGVQETIQLPLYGRLGSLWTLAIAVCSKMVSTTIDIVQQISSRA